MGTDWLQWQGQEVRGGLPLLRLLGSSERSAVFLSHFSATTRFDVAVKLVPAVSGQAEALLSRWRAAMAFNHPHLLRVFEVGECELGEHRYLFLVTEYAEQNLAQLLEHRALVPDEVREMLGPILDALGFLHGSERVHGGLKPSNVVVVGEQVKLASDSIGPASDVVSDGDAGSAGVVTLSPYQPPEAGSGVRSAAGDIWALGVTTCEALSRRKPAGLHAVGGGIALPADLPDSFGKMILKCLSRRAEERPDVARLQVWQRGGELPPERDGGAANVAQVETSSSPIRLVIRAELVPPGEIAEPEEAKAQWRLTRVIGAGAVLLVIVGGAIYFWGSRETSPVSSVSVVESGVAASVPPPEATASPSPTSQAPTSQAPTSQAPTSQAPTSQASTSQVPTSPVVPPPPPVSQAPAAEVPVARVATSDSSSTINEVIPDVPRSASQTIRGTVRVSVRVIVGEDGKVVAATADDPGPSRYFERLSLDAAKKWVFAPAESAEKRVMVVKFGYTRAGAGAKAVPAR